MTFSASDAAFEGFRVVRRKPAVILWWSLAYLVFFAVLILAIGGPFLSLMPQLTAMSQSGREPTAADFGAIMGLYGTVIAIAMPVAIVFSAILSAAVARSVLSPEASKFGYLRVGMDEVRVGVVTLVLCLLLFVAYVVVAIVVGVLIAIGAAAGNQGLAVLLAVLGGLAGCAALIWIAVRLSLAVPITMAEKRIAIFDSYGVTRGRFWPLFGMAVIAFVMTILVALLGMIVGLPFQIMGGAAFDQAAASGEMGAVMAAVGPMVILGFVVNLVVSALQLAVLYAPFSAAYLGIKGAPTGAAASPT